MKIAKLVRPVLGFGFGLLGLLGAARADTGSVDFTLDALPLAAGPAEAGAPGTVGHWLPDNRASVNVTTMTFNGAPTRSAYSYNGVDDTVAASLPPFGDSSHSFAALPGQQGAVHAGAVAGQLSVGWQTETPRDYIEALVTWSRSFALDPYSSLTFSGLASVTNPLQAAPSATWWNNLNSGSVHRGALTYQAPDYAYGGLTLYADILDRNPLDPTAAPQGRQSHDDDFSYSVDSFGHLAVTVFNRSAETLFGSFEMQLGAWTPVPSIPEPPMVLMMALGLMALAFNGRRRQGPPARRVAIPSQDINRENP